MPSLKKDAATGALLKNSSGALVDVCETPPVELNLEYNYTTRAISTVRPIDLEYNYTTRAISTVRPIDLEYNYTTRAISTVRPLDLEYNYEFVSVDVTEL